MNEIEILKRLNQVKNHLILKLYDHIYDEKRKNISIVLEYGECSLKEIMNEIKLGKGK
jgi:serine/threonine protein kinase